MNGMQIKAIEYINNRPVAHHHFPTAAKGDNAYRATISYNAFNTAQARQCKRDCMARRFWPLAPHDLRSIELMEDSMRRLGHEPKELPQHHHVDIWAFYKAVGYDYKNKRFIETAN